MQDFNLVDEIVAVEPDRIVARKHVTSADDYLQDHFPGFPILPGVMMIETMVQAARRLLEPEAGDRTVLGSVRALKYGAMVRPGQTLEVEVRVTGRDDGAWACRGSGRVLTTGEDAGDDAPTAVSGRFTMRRMRGAPAWTL